MSDEAAMPARRFIEDPNRTARDEGAPSPRTFAGHRNSKVSAQRADGEGITDRHTSDIGHWFAMTTKGAENNERLLGEQGRSSITRGISNNIATKKDKRCYFLRKSHNFDEIMRGAMWALPPTVETLPKEIKIFPQNSCQQKKIDV